MPNLDAADEERFYLRVEVGEFEECWPWTGRTEKKGHGRFDLCINGKYTIVYAHRVAFYFVHGRWPEPCALHGCDNPPCCNAYNTDHVHEGTKQDNVDEMFARGRHQDYPRMKRVTS